jgi:diguanylate cyclase (GGDEF)-like protein
MDGAPSPPPSPPESGRPGTPDARTARAAPPRRRSLQSRIALYFAILMVGAQVVVLVIVQTGISRNALGKIEEELKVGERVFRRQLEQNNRQLGQAADILSRDFAFRDAVATNDVPTIVSALQNHGSRIGASAMMLASTDRGLIADTNARAAVASGRPFPFPWLIDAAEREGKSAGIVLIEARAYQLVLVPVLAPIPIAWAAFGFPVDDGVARDLQSLTQLQVSFLSRVREGQWEMLASTLPEDGRAALREAVATTQGPAAPATNATNATKAASGGLRLAVDQHESLVLPLEQRAEFVVDAVLQRSLDEALAPFRPLQTLLLLLALGSTVFSVVLSVLLARSITRPIAQLSDLTRRLEEGDYAQAVGATGTAAQDEIGELARRFDLMREGIAAREDQILRLAYRDVLTNLPNRTLFNDRLGVALEQARRARTPLTVLLMDLDRFKHINDTLGHHAGDQALQQVALRLDKLMRKSDTTARLGGDEFAVLLSEADAEAGTQVARKILQVLEEPITLEGQQLDVRASVGIASFPLHGADAPSLLRQADSAMYAAKRGNTGFAVFDPRRDERSDAQLSLLGELRRALDRDELRLAFQPKIDIASGQVQGAECLLRWMHPERGMMAPLHFIPFAEQTGFIRHITAWVIERAVAQCGAWRSAGRSLKLAINISAPDLLGSQLPVLVAEALERHQVPAELLIMEITESSIMQEPARAIELLRELNALGVALSIDDFGTGYSSLAYIKQLPVHELKIDRSFTRHIVTDRKDRAIVLATVGLGHNLGLNVVAEGIEDAACLEALRELGCDTAQGYYIARPLEAGDFEAWLAGRGMEKPAVQAPSMLKAG